MTLPRPFWFLCLGQTLYRVGLLAPADGQDSGLRPGGRGVEDREMT